MEDRGTQLAGRLLQVVVAHQLRAGEQFFGAVAGQRRRRHDLPGHPQAPHGGLEVGVGGQVVARNLRGGERICVGHPHVTARTGAQIADRGGDRAVRVQRLPELWQRQRLNVPLQIRTGQRGITFREGPQRGRRHGHGSGAQQQILQSHARSGDPVAVQRVDGPGALYPVNRSQLQMVLEVLTHTRQIDGHRNLMLGEQPRRPQTRDLHEMRRADRTGAQDHLPTGLYVDDVAVLEQADPGGAVGSGGPGTVALIVANVIGQQQLQGLGVGVNGQVGPVGDGVQERVGHRPAPAATLVDMEVRTARVVSAVELVDRGDADLGGSGLPGVEDLPAHPWPLDGDLTPGAVPLVGSAEIVFQLLVERQCLAGRVRAAPTPPFVTGGLGPQLVIACLTAHVDHRVDRRAATEHPASRVDDAAAGQPRVGLGGEAPIGAGVGDRIQVANRHLDPEPVVFAPGLDQEHPVIGVGAEPVGEQAAGTARSDDDEIELGDGAHVGIVPRRPRTRVAGASNTRYSWPSGRQTLDNAFQYWPGAQFSAGRGVWHVLVIGSQNCPLMQFRGSAAAMPTPNSDMAATGAAQRTATNERACRFLIR